MQLGVSICDGKSRRYRRHRTAQPVGRALKTTAFATSRVDRAIRQQVRIPRRRHRRIAPERGERRQRTVEAVVRSARNGVPAVVDQIAVVVGPRVGIPADIATGIAQRVFHRLLVCGVFHRPKLAWAIPSRVGGVAHRSEVMRGVVCRAAVVVGVPVTGIARSIVTRCAGSVVRCRLRRRRGTVPSIAVCPRSMRLWCGMCRPSDRRRRMGRSGIHRCRWSVTRRRPGGRRLLCPCVVGRCGSARVGCPAIGGPGVRRARFSTASGRLGALRCARAVRGPRGVWRHRRDPRHTGGRRIGAEFMASRIAVDRCIRLLRGDIRLRRGAFLPAMVIVGGRVCSGRLIGGCVHARIRLSMGLDCVRCDMSRGLIAGMPIGRRRHRRIGPGRRVGGVASVRCPRLSGRIARACGAR